MSCNNCAWQNKYRERPKSFSGRLWKFHTRFCPGWKKHLKSLSEKERNQLLRELNFKR
jgi:hypothetical protein